MSFNPEIPYNDLPDLPPRPRIETSAVLKQVVEARSNLAELKGTLSSLGDPSLLLNSVVLRESQASSSIENIVTTQDEIYRAFSLDASKSKLTPGAKEVLRYRDATWSGLKAMLRSGGISTNVLLEIVQELRGFALGIRKTPGTKLMNPISKEVIYTPPEGADLLSEKLSRLEKFVHNPDVDLDPLIVAALMHYQFESIHPFSDGNGRTGRIAIVLYLVLRELLNGPVLFLSQYFLQNRDDYYRLLRDVTKSGRWEEWILYFLKAISKTSSETLIMVSAIVKLRTQVELEVAEVLGSAYSSQIASLLHIYPYTKIRTLTELGIVKRETASKYLSKLVDAGVLEDEVQGRDRYFINHRLIKILSQY